MGKYLSIIVFYGLFFVFVLLFSSCEKEKAVFFPPELGEMKVSDITDTSLCVKCSVIKNDELPLQEVGFCVYQSKDISVVRYIKCDNQESFSTTITNLLPQTNYNVKAYAKNVAGTTYSEAIISMTYSGYINEHPYIDLGLPSGTLWAACNIGAYNQEDFGNYYAWGQITTKENYNWKTYIYAEGTTNDDPRLIKYCNSYEYGNNYYADNLTVLESSDDVASTTWGASWRMPTYNDFEELKNYCTVTWTTQNGVSGRLFTGTNGNAIFLPAAGSHSDSSLDKTGLSGCYWTSSFELDDGVPWFLLFASDDYDVGLTDRYYGLSVRPVCN